MTRRRHPATRVCHQDNEVIGTLSDVINIHFKSNDSGVLQSCSKCGLLGAIYTPGSWPLSISSQTVAMVRAPRWVASKICEGPTMPIVEVSSFPASSALMADPERVRSLLQSIARSNGCQSCVSTFWGIPPV